MQTKPNLTHLNLEYLGLEISRIDLLVRREVRRWQLAGQDLDDTYRGLYISDHETNHLVSRPLAVSWGQTMDLPHEDEDNFTKQFADAQKKIDEFLTLHFDQTDQILLKKLSSIFNLTPIDIDILLICLAPALDLKYEQIFGYLQDDVTRKQPGVNLLLNLLAPPGLDRFSILTHLSEQSPLVRFQLIDRIADSSNQPVLRQSLMVNETIFRWLLGNYQSHPDYAPFIVYSDPVLKPVDQLLSTFLHSEVHPELYSSPHFIFSGPDDGCQIATAQAIAKKLEKPLLSIDLFRINHNERSLEAAVRIILRDSLLLNAIPMFSGWDICLDDNNNPPDNLTLEVCEFPDTLIISSQSEWGFNRGGRDLNFIKIHFPVIDYAQRTKLWQYFLPSEFVPDDSAATLAGQFELTSTQIQATFMTAQDIAYKNHRPINIEDLASAARSHSNAHLSSLARKVTPRYGWSDIVLPVDQIEILHEIIATFRGKARVLVEWGVGEKLVFSAGIPILFSGPPGTGKTMAAEIIASELGLDLYKVDLSTIVSKYIGETEKNMERIFSEAESSNAILFFDEADALFGKRSEVRDSHDRYANIEISYLLQRMEVYDGVTILATNLKANLDEAFTRRLQFSVNFPFPDEADRLRIWRTLFPPKVPREPDIDLQFLASRYRLAGGNIRNILVNAAFLASADGGQVTMHHILHSTHREYQKLGRLVGEEDFRVG